jgi:PAS domain S-box-containing protein
LQKSLPSHSLLLVGLVGAFLAAEPALGLDLFPDAGDRARAGLSFFLPLLAAAVACAAACWWHWEERLTWGPLAIALAVGAAAGSAFPLSDQTGEPLPAMAVVAYCFFCVVSGVVVLRASGRLRARRAIDQGLVVCAFGLGTAWTWLFLAPAQSSAGFVHSSFDLLLALGVLAAFCNHGWPASPRFGMLGGGIGLLAVADSLHGVGGLTNVAGLDIAHLLPFAGAALIAAAGCLGPPRSGGRAPSGRLVVALTFAAVLLAIAALVYDHYSRLDAGTILLASLTLLAAGVRLTRAQRGWRDARARAREAELAGALEVAGLDAALAIDPAGRVVSCNARAREVFCRDEAELIGQPVADLLGDLPGRSLAGLLQAGQNGSQPTPVELRAHRPQGLDLPVEVAVASFKPGAELRTLIVRDITERRRREEENRRLAAIIRSSDDAVLTKDLNGVVTGWNQGAQRLYGYTAEEAIGRRVDELVIPRGRQHEAMKVLSEAGAGETVSFETQRLTKAGTTIDVSLRAFPIRGLSGEVTAICTVGHDVSERRRRERAEERETEATLWRRRLRQAIDEGGLVFHGQPILDLESGQIHHHELLVRMRLDGKLVLPGSFLPYAEEAELIHDLDLWAVERGIQLAAQTPVAINLSARSIDSRDILQVIERKLGADAMLAPNITFEITETAAAGNMEGARELVIELMKMGCAVALDDFGTGYGSFTYLRHLPVTQLKIDAEFISGLGSDPADKRVVESIVAVARNFEMVTVAEGVEDQETFEMLEDLGVDLVQGYYVGRPQPLERERGRRAIHG